MTSAELDRHAAEMLATGALDKLEMYLNALNTRTKKLVILVNLIRIFKEEVKNNEPFTVFDYSLNLDELVKHYMVTKLLLRRLDFDMRMEYQEEFYHYCLDTHVSHCFIEHLIAHNMVNRDRVIGRIVALFEKGGEACE